MAFACVFPCEKTLCVSHFNPTALTHVCPLIRRTNLLIPRGEEVVPNLIFGTTNVRICTNHRRKPEKIPRIAATSESDFEGLSVSDVITKFYTCINKDDKKGLEDLISSNCRLEDTSFPYVIHGKKEVMKLFIQLAESMGENVQFKLGTVCEGEELTVTVNWHLEWKEDQIPFSRGCTIFQCSNEGDRLVIRKAQIITESPLKPGIFALALLKVVTSFFNDFPNAAKWFLKSPHTILQAVLNIYGLFLAPFFNPVITFYLTLWKFIARTLGYAVSFFHIIARFFNTKTSSTDHNDNKDTSNFETEQGPSSLP